MRSVRVTIVHAAPGRGSRAVAGSVPATTPAPGRWAIQRRESPRPRAGAGLQAPAGCRPPPACTATSPPLSPERPVALWGAQPLAPRSPRRDCARGCEEKFARRCGSPSPAHVCSHTQSGGCGRRRTRGRPGVGRHAPWPPRRAAWAVAAGAAAGPTAGSDLAPGHPAAPGAHALPPAPARSPSLTGTRGSPRRGPSSMGMMQPTLRQKLPRS